MLEFRSASFSARSGSASTIGIESGVTIVSCPSAGSAICRRSAASARARASRASSTAARARSSASSLFSRSFSPILPTSNRPLLSVYSVSLTATLFDALRERDLLRVEVEERVRRVAARRPRAPRDTPAPRPALEVLHALVPHDLSRAEQLLLELHEDRRRLISREFRVPNSSSRLICVPRDSVPPVSGIAWLKPSPSCVVLCAWLMNCVEPSGRSIGLMPRFRFAASPVRTELRQQSRVERLVAPARRVARAARRLRRRPLLSARRMASCSVSVLVDWRCAWARERTAAQQEDGDGSHEDPSGETADGSMKRRAGDYS